jgi:hypothetical protein
MTKRRINAAPRQFWTVDQDNELRRLYPHAQTIDVARAIGRTLAATYGRAGTLGLTKSAEYLASPEAHRFDGLKGIGTRFQKGIVPANKGLRRPGWARGRMKETQFKKGNRSKRWDPEVYVVGALRINRDGYLDIKFKEGPRAWKQLSRYVWETERGPIPPNHVVRTINGDGDDTRLENLRLMTRRELMLENTLHRYPKEIAKLIQLRGALNRQINRRAREKQDRGSAQSPVRHA